MTTMHGKIVLITGGTSGIGRETAVGLAKMGAHIVVTGRDQQRGETGVADIKARSGNQNIDLMLADFASFAEIRQFASDFQAQYDRLDVLINNVGLVPQTRYETVDGIESTLAVNYLAPFLLTHKLLPILKASSPARVINVTGGQIGNGEIDFDDLQGEKSFVSLNHYSHAKRVLMAGSYEFARRLEGTGVTLNVVYPGAADTNMTRDMKPDMMPWFMRPIFPLFRLFMGNAKPENAAVSSILLASGDEYAGKNGNYYDTKGKLDKWGTGTLAAGVAERVWNLSVDMVGLEEPVTA